MVIWNRCAICRKSIPVGELCYGVKNWRGDPIGGDTICRDCLVPENAPTLTPPNEPLTQADLDGMDYDKVWIDYGDDGEWALVVYGKIYSLSNLEGCGFEDILRDEVGGETMDRPSGDYKVYRHPPEEEKL